MKQQRFGFVARVEALEAQVQRRDREIERLGQMLEGGRPFESVYAETLQGQEERRMAQLGTQVDLLQHTNRELQERLEKAREQGDERGAKVRSVCRPFVSAALSLLAHSELCLTSSGPPTHPPTHFLIQLAEQEATNKRLSQELERISLLARELQADQLATQASAARAAGRVRFGALKRQHRPLAPHTHDPPHLSGPSRFSLPGQSKRFATA